jgi:hypothetical protein
MLGEAARAPPSVPDLRPRLAIARYEARPRNPLHNLTRQQKNYETFSCEVFERMKRTGPASASPRDRAGTLISMTARSKMRSRREAAKLKDR